MEYPWEVRPTEAGDIPHIAEHLRPEDIREMQACSGADPLTGLTLSCASSTACYSVVIAGQAEVLFGVCASDLPSFGLVWLMGTQRLFKERPTLFLRQSRTWLAELHTLYPALGNFVDCRNTVHVNWLRWLDFKFLGYHESFGVAQIPFYEFAHHV